MMNISDIAKYVWNNSRKVEFGNSPQWDNESFTSRWNNQDWKKSGVGWYWFMVDMTYDELHSISKPPALPNNGCDIGLCTHENNELFGDSLLCKPEDNQQVVIYNGHEEKVTDRIRQHFALNNNKTGAIGLKHYPLSGKKWSVRYFSASYFSDNIDEEDKKRIKSLMNNSIGRCAVESAWRTTYGWPVLCKR